MSPRRALFTLLVALVACNHAAPEPAGSGPTDSGAKPPPTDASVACFTNPTTYLEIINACTDAQAIDKVVDLSSMSSSDGGLRPLP